MTAVTDNKFNLFLYIITLVTVIIMALTFTSSVTCDNGECSAAFSFGSLVPVLLFFLWSALPPVVFALFLRFRFRSLDTMLKKIYILALFLVLVIFPGLIHFLWIQDAGGIASGSSTSALIFIWITICSILLTLPLILLFESVRFAFFREKKG